METPPNRDTRQAVNARKLALLYREVEDGKRTMQDVERNFRLTTDDISMAGGLAEGVTRNARGIGNAALRVGGLFSDDLKKRADRNDALEEINSADFDHRADGWAEGAALVGDIGSSLIGGGALGAAAKGLRAVAGAQKGLRLAAGLRAAKGGTSAMTALKTGAALDGALSLGAKGSSATAALAGEDDGGFLDVVAANPFLRAGSDAALSFGAGKAIGKATDWAKGRFGKKATDVAAESAEADAAMARQAARDAAEEAPARADDAAGDMLGGAERAAPPENFRARAEAAGQVYERRAGGPNSSDGVRKLLLDGYAKDGEKGFESLFEQITQEAANGRPTTSTMQSGLRNSFNARSNAARVAEEAAAPRPQGALGRASAARRQAAANTTSPAAVATQAVEGATLQADLLAREAVQTQQAAQTAGTLAQTAQQAEQVAMVAGRQAEQAAQQAIEIVAPKVDGPLVTLRKSRNGKPLPTPTVGKAVSEAPISPVQALSPAGKGRVTPVSGQTDMFAPLPNLVAEGPIAKAKRVRKATEAGTPASPLPTVGASAPVETLTAEVPAVAKKGRVKKVAEDVAPVEPTSMEEARAMVAEPGRKILSETEQAAQLILAGKATSPAEARAMVAQSRLANRSGQIDASVIQAIAGPTIGAIAGAATADDGERLSGALGGAALGAGATALARAGRVPTGQAAKAEAKATKRVVASEALDVRAVAAANARQAVKDSKVIGEVMGAEQGALAETMAQRQVVGTRGKVQESKAAVRTHDQSEMLRRIDEIIETTPLEQVADEIRKLQIGGNRDFTDPITRKGARVETRARNARGIPALDDVSQIASIDRIAGRLNQLNALAARGDGKFDDAIADINDSLFLATKRATQAGRDMAWTRWATEDAKTAPYWLMTASRLKNGARLSSAEITGIQRETELYAQAVAGNDPLETLRARNSLLGSINDTSIISKATAAAALYKAALLSSGRTMANNLSSTLGMAVDKVVTGPISAAVDALVSQGYDVPRAVGTLSQQAAAMGDLLDRKTLGRIKTKEKGGAGLLGSMQVAWEGRGRPVSLAGDAVSGVNNAVLFGEGRLASGLDAAQKAIFGIMGATDQAFRVISATREASEVLRVLAGNAGAESVDAYVKANPQMMFMLIGESAKGVETADNILRIARAGASSNKSILGRVAESDVFQNDTALSSMLESGRSRVREFSPTLEAVASSVAVPFVKTPASVLDRMIEYSPLTGLMYSAVKNFSRRGAAGVGPDGVPNFAQAIDAYREANTRLAKALGSAADESAAGTTRKVYEAEQASAQANLMLAQRRLTQSMARGVTGLAVTAAAAGVFMEGGRITAEFPKDPEERAIWAAEGRTANSILINGRWIPLMALGPTGAALAGGAAFWKADKEREDAGLDGQNRDVVSRIADAATNTARATMDNPMMSGLDNIQKAAEQEGASKGERAARLVGGLVPTVFGDITRAIQPAVRRQDADSFMGAFGQTLGARIPGVASLTPFKRDAMGQPLSYGNDISSRLANLVIPGTRSRANDNPLLGELARGGTPIAPLRRNKGNVLDDEGNLIPSETPEEFAMRQVDRGRAMRPTLEGMLDSEAYQQAPIGLRKKTVDRIARGAGKMATSKKAQAYGVVMKALRDGRITQEQAQEILSRYR